MKPFLQAGEFISSLSTPNTMSSSKALGKRRIEGTIKEEESSKGDMVLNQMLIVTNMLYILDKGTVKSLTLISQSISKTTRLFIENNWVFRLKDRSLKQFKGVFRFYTPKKMFEVGSLSQIQHYFNNITHLNLSYKFLEPIKEYPPNLVYLEFSKYHQEYAHPIQNLPPNLTHLYLPNKFNHAIELPSKLQHFRVGSCYNQPVDNLPHSITHLYLGSINGDSRFDQPIEKLPPNLICLMLGKQQIYKSIQNLPRTITFLSFGDYFDEPVSVANLPPNLTHLMFGQQFSRPVNNLPPKITHLYLDFHFNKPIKNLPPNLKQLIVNSDVFNKKIGELPPSLTSLWIRFPEKAKFDKKYEPLLTKDFPDWVRYHSLVFNNFG